MQSKNKVLLIYGAGGLGREVYDLANRNNDGRWSRIVFLDDSCDGRREFYGTEVMTLEEALDFFPEAEVEGIVAVGEPSVRELLYNKLRQSGIIMATLIDKTALVSQHASIAEGTIVCEFVTIHAGVTILKNCLIQPYTCLGHDIQIGNHVVLSAYCAPGGLSKFGDRVFVGMHATIKDEVTVSQDSIISMGAVVFRDVPSLATVVGNPARETKGNPLHKVFL